MAELVVEVSDVVLQVDAGVDPMEGARAAIEKMVETRTGPMLFLHLQLFLFLRNLWRNMLSWSCPYALLYLYPSWHKLPSGPLGPHWRLLLQRHLLLPSLLRS
jgi:hypothetical protein